MSHHYVIFICGVIAVLILLYELRDRIKRWFSSETRKSPPVSHQAPPWPEEKEPDVVRQLNDHSKSSGLRPLFTPPPPPPVPTDEELRAELANADTIDEALEVYNGAPSASPVEEEAKQKIVAIAKGMCEKASTIEQCWEAAQGIWDASLGWDETNTIAIEVLEKGAALLDSFEETKEFFEELENQNVDDDDLKWTVLKSALEKAKFSECLDLYDELNRWHTGFEDEEEAALARAYELAANADECGELHERLDSDDALDDKILIKLIGFTNRVSDCQELWEEFGADTHVGEVAICRAADIIRARAQMLVAPTGSADAAKTV